MGWFIPWPWVAGTAANFGGYLAMEMGDCGTQNLSREFGEFKQYINT